MSEALYDDDYLDEGDFEEFELEDEQDERAASRPSSSSARRSLALKAVHIAVRNQAAGTSRIWQVRSTASSWRSRTASMLGRGGCCRRSAFRGAERPAGRTSRLTIWSLNGVRDGKLLSSQMYLQRTQALEAAGLRE